MCRDYSGRFYRKKSTNQAKKQLLHQIIIIIKKHFSTGIKTSFTRFTNA